MCISGIVNIILSGQTEGETFDLFSLGKIIVCAYAYIPLVSNP